MLKYILLVNVWSMCKTVKMALSGLGLGTVYVHYSSACEYSICPQDLFFFKLIGHTFLVVLLVSKHIAIEKAFEVQICAGLINICFDNLVNMSLPSGSKPNPPRNLLGKAE